MNWQCELRQSRGLRLTCAFALSFLIALCLAAPVLTGKLELFLLSERSIPLFNSKLQWLRGLGSLAAVYPWSLGTFRSLDLSKFLGDQALGFYLFIGSLAFVLAIIGGCLRPAGPIQNRPRRMALVSVERLRPQMGDWIYESTVRGETQGVFKPIATPGLARFQWQGVSPRAFQLQDLILNRIRLTFEPGPAGELLWTDTHYPGWKAEADGRVLPLRKAEPCFSKIEIPSEIRTVNLRFEPRYLRPAMWFVLAGILGMGLLSYSRPARSNK